MCVRVGWVGVCGQVERQKARAGFDSDIVDSVESMSAGCGPKREGEKVSE